MRPRSTIIKPQPTSPFDAGCNFHEHDQIKLAIKYICLPIQLQGKLLMYAVHF